jgi:RNA polymerase sigma factor (sigma-70 family)
MSDTAGEEPCRNLARAILYEEESLERLEVVLCNLLSELLGTLKPREVKILTCYYGGMTLEEIGSVLGITRERVRQIKKKSLSTLSQRVLSRLHAVSRQPLSNRRSN